ncbi:hypothetical protein [Aurantimonas coralicida]|uniref:hypothetical protein n=1 Tax=Aurantimonas coralicida TaxID=182270 RepID=UPI001E4AE541|nr:hypothetical protein [Aurantimonas coralicida]MCD1645436.1 hypothetical protein [Aurantimonas coralicida]MCW7546308.1 hypothetical protein [Aurantimonas litoralis]
MKQRPLALRLIAFLVLAAITMAPFGDAMAVARMTDEALNGSNVAMEGMDMRATPSAADVGTMPCCPDSAPTLHPASDCYKSACPSMASCTQQCIPAATLVVASDAVSLGEADAARMPGSVALASLSPEPPPRPPRT